MSLRKASKVPGRGARTIKQVDPVQRRKAIIRSAASYAVEALETRTMLSLVAQWKFDESAGATALDSSGHNLDATVHNGTSFVSSGRGDGGNAVYFNGSTQYGDVGDSDLLDNSGQMSFSFWVNPSLLDGQPRAVLSKRVNNNDNHAYSIFFHTGNKLYVDIVGSNNRFSSNTVFSTNTWYHVAVVYDGSAATQQVKLYVNGVLDKAAAETSTLIPNYASNLYLAQHNLNYSTKFQGKLDDVRIYDNALTSDEVSRFVTPPTIASAAAISPSPVTDTSATLSVLGSDSQGESALTYTWSVLSMPSGATAPTFSTNGTNSAKNSTVTFAKAGSYTLRAAINNGYSVSISDVTFTVSQTIASILVTPSTVTVVPSGTAQFTTSARDQFGDPLATQPTFTWSVQSGGGSIDSSGLYTASSSGGNATVAATASGVTGTAGVNTVLPVVHLKMDESSGATATDSSGNVDISLVNGPTFVASNRPGGNNALSFNATNQYGYHTDSGVLDNTGKLTVALWVKANVLDGNAHGLVAKRVSYLNENSFSLLFNTDNRFYVDFGDYAYRASSNTIFDAGQWYHIAAVFDGTQPAASRVKIYVNGTLDKTASNGLTTIPDFGSSLYIGALQPGYSPLNGMIDDVRIYRDALDGKQLMDMLGVPAAPTGLSAAKVTNYFRHVSLAWTDNADNETGFRVERRAGFTGSWTTLQTLGANTTSYLDTTAAPGTMYYYRVVAFNNSGDSAEAKVSFNTAELPIRIGSSTSNPSGVLTLNVDTAHTNYNWVKEYKVDWGDGQITGVITGTPPDTLSHAYATPGSYTPIIQFVDAELDWTRSYVAHLNYDSTLGSVGKVVTPLPTLSTTYPWTGAKAVTALANGQYLVAGHNIWAGFAVARYNANGTLDNNFGNGGWSIIDFGSSYQHNVSSIAVQSDGKIVVAGDVNISGAFDWAVARFNADGSPDSTFGNTGIAGAARFDSTSTSERGNAVTVDSNGRILVSGFADRDMAVVAFTSSGQVDGSFGNGGITKANLGGDTQDIAYGINLQGNQIVVSGRSDLQVAVVRFNASGQRDTTFNNGTGKFIADLAINNGFEALYHISVHETTGSILLIGEVDAHIALVRLTSSGTIDTTFGGGTGRVLTRFERNYLGWTALVDGSDIYVGGMVNRSPASFLVARYSTSGVLDTSFGDNGAIETTITQDAVRSMVLTLTKSGGTTTAVGTVQTNNYDDFALVRMRDTHSVQVGIGSTLNTTLTASANNADSLINLAWTVVGPGIISGFKIERAENGGAFSLYQQIDDFTVRDWQDTNVVRGTTYQYRVIPFGTTTDYAPSNIATASLANAWISGTVWLDANRNTRWDQNGGTLESGSGGHRVYGDINSNGVFDTDEPSVMTAVNGYYELGLTSGIYSIRVAPTADYWVDSPIVGFQAVEVGSDQSVTGVNFGVLSNQAPSLGTLAPPDVEIDPYASVPLSRDQVAWGWGNVFVGTHPDSKIREYSTDGGLARTLSQPMSGSMLFEPDGSVLTTVKDAGQVVRISPDGMTETVVIDNLQQPESLAEDAWGNIYVGANGHYRDFWTVPEHGGIYKFTHDGQLLGHWLDNVQIDRIDLSPNQHTLLFIGVDGQVSDVNGQPLEHENQDDWGNGWAQAIHQLDLNTGEVQPAFATGLRGAGNVRFLADGRVLVPDRDRILLLSEQGQFIRDYDAAGNNVWFAVNLDPDGLSFWALDAVSPESGPWNAPEGSGELMRFDIASGKLLARFDGIAASPLGSGLAQNKPREIAVYGDAVAATAPILNDFVYQVPATDPDSDPLTFELVGNTHGAEIDPGTGVLRWTPTATGTYSFTVRATDPMGASDEKSFDVNVVLPGNNHAPVITTQSLSDARVGVAYQNRINASDPDGDRLTWSLIDTPGLAIDSRSGAISWLPTSQDRDNTPKLVTVRATDARGAFDERTFNISVLSEAVVPAALRLVGRDPVWYFRIGQERSFTIEVYEDFTAPFTFFHGALPPGMRLVPTSNEADNRAWSVVWTPTAVQTGDYQIKVAIGDGRGGYFEDEIPVVVAARVATVPKVLVVAPQEKVDFLRPRMYDATGNEIASTRTPFLQWLSGPGIVPEDGQSFTASSQDGLVELRDFVNKPLTNGGDSLAAFDDIKILVASGDARIGAVTAGGIVTEGQTVEFAGDAAHGFVGQFYDTRNGALPGDYMVSINWGDGQTSVGNVVVETDPSIPENKRVHLFNIGGSHTYASEGSFTITVTVQQSGQSDLVFSSESGQELQVRSAPVELDTLGINSVVNQEFNDIIATFKDGITGSTASDFRAVIEWGDGTRSDGIIGLGQDGDFEVRGIHTFKRLALAGQARITIFEKQSGGVEEYRVSDLLYPHIDLTSLPTPTNVSVSTISQSIIQISWGNVPDAYGYVIRRFNPDGTITDTRGVTTSNPYMYQNLAPGVRYGFQVLASDPWRTLSLPSPIIYAQTTPDAPPQTPTGLRASARSTRVELYWKTDPTADGWDVLRAVSVDGLTPPADTDYVSLLPSEQMVPSNSYIDDEVNPSSHYWYKVVAIRGTLRSTASSAVEALTSVINVPTNVEVGYAGYYASQKTRRVGLKWNAIDDPDLLGYDIYRGTVGNFITNATSLVGTSLNPRYTDDILGDASGQTYYYKVRAVYARFNGEERSSAPSAVVSINTVDTNPSNPSLPEQPDSLDVQSNTSNSVNITWSDNSLNEAGFWIYRRDFGDSGLGERVGAVTADEVSFDDPSVNAGGDYEYIVAAHNMRGETRSSPLRVTTPAAGPAPSAPTWPTSHPSLKAYNQVSLDWNAPSSSPAVIVGYNIYRRQDASSDAYFVRLNSQPVTDTSFIDRTVRAGTAYTFRVVAVSAGNQSLPLEDTFTTDIAPELRPIVRIASPATFSGITLNFDDETTDGRIRMATPVRIVVDDLNDDSEVTWELTLRPLGADGKLLPGPGTKLASGSGLVGSPEDAEGTFVYTLDPSQFANGQYRLVLAAEDETGPGTPDEITVSLFSNNKTGNVVLPSTDFQFNVPGQQPMVVRRVYDSSRANELLDFGYGWRLEVSDSLIRTTARPAGIGEGMTFREGDLVYVNLPGGGQHVFQFLPVPNNYSLANGANPYFGYQDYWVQFIAVDGSNATLRVQGDMYVAVDDRLNLRFDREHGLYRAVGFDGSGLDFAYDPANPAFGDRYQLITADGTTYDINASTGQLRSITDANNITTEYSDRSIAQGAFTLNFVRNPSGVITQINLTNERGVDLRHVDYEYDSSGNLSKFTDVSEIPTRYLYEQPGKPHLLTKVVDWRNLVMLTASYDDTGRLQTLSDVAATAMTAGLGQSDGASGGEFVVAPPTSDQELPSITENINDSRGNVIRQIRTVTSGEVLLGYQVTVYQYDYFSADLAAELTDIFDTAQGSAKKPGSSSQNSLTGMREYAPIFVAAADGDTRYTVDPTRLRHETRFNAGQSADAKLPSLDIVYLDPTDETLWRKTTRLENYQHGKPTLVTTQLEKSTNGGQDWAAVGDPSFARSFYYPDGNLQFQFNALGEGTEFVYSDKSQGIPAGLLLATYKARLVNGQPQRVTIDEQGHYLILSQNAYYDTTDTLAGKFKGALAWSQSGTAPKTFYGYDQFGRVARTWRHWDNPNTGQPGRWVVDSTTYDELDRVTATSQQVYLDNGTANVLEVDPDPNVAVNGFYDISELAYSDAVTTSTEYDELGRVESTTDQFGGTTSNTYDFVGNLIQVAYPDGTVTRSTYDNLGRLVWQTDRFVPSGTNVPTTATQAIYDSLGRVIRTERRKNVVVDLLEYRKEDANSPIQHDGDFDPQPYSQVDFSGSTILSAEGTIYDAQGRVVETDRYAGNAANAYLRTGTIYTDSGRVLLSGVLKTNTAPTPTQNWTGQFTAADFVSYTSSTPDQVDLEGNLHDRIVDARGNHTDTYKDVLGRVTRTVFDDGTFTQTLYAPTGSEFVTTIDDVRVDHPSADPEGWPGVPVGGRWEIRIAQRKAYENGNYGDPDPDKRVLATHYLYDAQGRLTDVWLPPVDDATTTSTDKVHPHWHYDYDDDGNQISQTDPSGHTTSFTYDHAGQRTSRTLPGGETESWTYNQFGQLVTHVDFNGQTTLSMYDTPGRIQFEYRYAFGDSPTGPTVPGNAWSEQTYYDYDSMGRLYAINENGPGVGLQATRYEYDPITGAQTRETIYDGAFIDNVVLSDVHHEYDEATGLLTETWSGASEASATTMTLYGYDNQGRLLSVSSSKIAGSTPAAPNVQYDRYDTVGNAITTPLPTTVYAYDLAGNLHTVSLPNGVTTTCTYDNLNRLTDVVMTNDDNYKLFEQDYTLLSNGQRDSVTEKRYDGQSTNPFSTTKVDWEYDDDGRLTGETRDEGNDGQDGEDYIATYGYDLNGNRLSKVFNSANNAKDETVGYTYNSNDQLTAEDSTIDANDAGYTYDENGSTTSKTTGPAGGTQTTVKYLWDLRNRMVAVDGNDDDLTIDTDGNASGTVNDSSDSTYAYDSEGGRIEKATPGGDTTIFVNDKANPTGYTKVLEEKAAPTAVPARTYILGHDVLGQADSATSLQYLLKDGHGTTRALLGDEGAALQSYDFDAFLNPLNADAVNAQTPYLAPDGRTDFETGLRLNGARYVRDGWFFSRDPGWEFAADLSAPASLHQYVYASANPALFIDATGEFSLPDLLAASGIGSMVRAIYDGYVEGGGMAASMAVSEIGEQLRYMAALQGVADVYGFDELVEGRDYTIFWRGGLEVPEQSAGDVIKQTVGEALNVRIPQAVRPGRGGNNMSPSGRNSPNKQVHRRGNLPVMQLTPAERKAIKIARILAEMSSGGMVTINSSTRGTVQHTSLRDIARKNGMHGEVSYLLGKEVKYGTKGSVRVDLLSGSIEEPTLVFDMKTGNAKMTASRAQQMFNNLPKSARAIVGMKVN